MNAGTAGTGQDNKGTIALQMRPVCVLMGEFARKNHGCNKNKFETNC